MKNIIYLIVSISLFVSCGKDNDEDVDLKQEMRDFVIGISEYCKAEKSSFLVIPQNGIELVTTTGDEFGDPAIEYLDAIDGNGQEDLYYGYNDDDELTPTNESNYLEFFLDISKDNGNQVLVTNYCSSPSKMNDSYSWSNSSGYISFAANERELNNIPVYPNPIYAENSEIITDLSEVKNFLYLINPENYLTRAEFISAVTSINYDLLIMDLFFNDDSEFTASEVETLKNKANGGKRLVVAYMSIGEAEDYRYYWDDSWLKNDPDWMDEENPDWEGNYKVRYWKEDWQSIIYGNDDSYSKKILNAGFDGVYLDIIDAYEYYEDMD